MSRFSRYHRFDLPERFKALPDSFWRLKLTDAIMSLGTIALAFVAYLQWCTLEKTDHTLRETLAASNAVQRAVIAPTKLQMEPLKDDQSKVTHWMFTPYLKNSGNTQAIYMRANGIMSGPLAENAKPLYPTVTIPEAPGDPELVYRNDPRRGKNILGPGVEIPIAGGGVPVHALRLTSQKDQRWYFYGIAKYRDIFDHTPLHTVKYCYVVTTVTTWDGQTPPDYHLCGYWNCADDTCAQDRADYETDLREAFSTARVPFPKEMEFLLSP